MMRMGALAGLVAAMLAGCMPMGEDAPARDDAATYVCNASPAQAMVGQVASQALGTEAVRASKARTMRWIGPDTMVTMDFRTDRLNIHLDAQNKVTRITCG